MKHAIHRAMGLMTGVVIVGGSAGCVQVTAPSRPIEIVLTINIRQEIVYRLNGAAQETIDSNAGIF